MANKAAGTKGDLRLSNLTKTFGDFKAVDDLSLVIPEGSFFANWSVFRPKRRSA